MTIKPYEFPPMLPRPPGLTDEQWANRQAMAQCDFLWASWREAAVECIEEFCAVDITREIDRNPSSFWRSG